MRERRAVAGRKEKKKVNVLGGRYRTDSWRYHIIKHYRRRAQKFLDESKTVEEMKAWGEVVEWFDSILQMRYLTRRKAICALPKLKVEELEMR